MTSTTTEVYDPFASEAFLRIDAIEVLEVPRLKVRFDDGQERIVDFSPVIERNRWFRTLTVPATFETVEVIHGGRGLQWITGADYCADALRILADEQLAERKTS